MNNSPNDLDHKLVLYSTRHLNLATKNCPGRSSSDEVFVTSDQRSYMYEIVKIDPQSLSVVISQFSQYIESKGKMMNITNLRQLLTENLISTYANLPGYSDEDEEWFSQLSSSLTLSSPKSPKSSKSPKSQNSLISRPKFEPKISPWVTKYRTSTEMPKNYSNYIEGISFLGIYEIIRILKPFGPIEPTNRLWNQIICGAAIHEVLYDECKRHYQDHPNYFAEMSKIINKNLSRVWSLSSKESNPADTTTRKYIIFSGDVVLKDRQLVLTLNPPRTSISKRYYRIFSSERFLHLKINMDMNSLDYKQKSNLKNLLLHPLSLAGRTYEFLYAKSDTLYYFATRGLDLPNDISIREAIDRNLPIERNGGDTIAKFYNRISLGFSNSTPTIIFEPNEILHDEDITIDGNCFTDGCSAISLAAMKEVAEILGYQETPSALQGRIGGAKGIWYIEPRRDISGKKWIKLRKSQRKYNVTDDVHLRTLEVLSVVEPPRSPGTLNSQFIRVLLEGGVPIEVFHKIMKDHIEKIKSQLIGCDDPCTLIAWVMNVSNVMTKRYETFNRDNTDDGSSNGDGISGFPNSPSEQCIQLLQAGFTPSTCPFLAKKLKCVLSLSLRTLSSKFRIEVSLSRVLLCIADPTGTLEPGEIFIQLDKEAGRDERTGLPFGIIEDEVIVARNPSTLPSDIVKVKAVKNTHLSIYYNVVVFPVKIKKKGDVSLAAYLGGGDYDGDRIFCCWDPQIVKNFINSPIVPIDPDVKKAFVKNNQTVNGLLSSIIPDKIEIKLQEIILDNYFMGLEPTLGLYDRWHRLQSNKYGLSDKLSIYLAQMCAVLVDSAKQGLTIDPNVRRRDNDRFGNLPVPYWMDKDNKVRDRSNDLILDKMDFLHITIENEMREINSKDFLIAKMTKDPDPHINEFWCNEFNRAQQMEGEEGSAYAEDLELIYDSSSEIIKMYNNKYYNIFNDERDRKEPLFEQSSKSTNSSSKLNDKFKGVDHEFLMKFLNTPSVENYKSSIFKFLKGRGSLTLDNIDPLTTFELQLKAAALHLFAVEKKPAGQGCWVIAFRILCNIKSQMMDRQVVGGPRSVIEEVWQSMKVDRKWLK